MKCNLRFVRGLSIPLFCFALLVTPSAEAQKGSKAKAAQADPPVSTKGSAGSKDSTKKLRNEWDLASLKLTREAVDETNFPADIKNAAAQSVDWFLSQQEALLSDVQRNPQNESKARTQRSQLEQSFKQKMANVYNNPTLMKELGKQLKALQKEMEDMAAGADKVFANLDAAGVTPEQKKKLAPVVAEAQKKIASARSKDEKEEAVASYKQAKDKVRQNLTPEQKEKLKKKLAGEA